tara:strand:- start:135 stop:545 length:411 start_codon:yes stop_codon:yes gene_type:complete
MGKKRKMRAYPQRFGRKHGQHPAFLNLHPKVQDVLEEALEDGVVTKEESVKIEKTMQEVKEAPKAVEAVKKAGTNTAPAKPELDVVSKTKPAPKPKSPVKKAPAPKKPFTKKPVIKKQKVVKKATNVSSKNNKVDK